MGKTIVKHEDVDKLYFELAEKSSVEHEMGLDEFHEIVSEVFGIALPENQDVTLEEMLESVTDENKQELIV
jgi:hypothetical protein